MGYAVVHMMKIGKGGVRGIQSHNQREKQPRTNPDIDKKRSADNYDLLGSRLNYHREINDRIATYATGTKTVRKDAVMLCNFIITSDETTMKAMSPEMQKSFFEDSVKFFSDRYGKEKLVNATVHMDETTPHMHIGLVPITKDGRLSAKSLFTKSELHSLQTDFAKQVGERHGLERGIEGSERSHLSEQQFKTKTALEKEKSMIESVNMLSKHCTRLKKDTKGLEMERDILINKIGALEGKLDALDSEAKTLMQKFVSHPKIKPLFDEYCKAERKMIQNRQEQRKSLKADLARYQTEAAKKKQTMTSTELSHREKMNRER